MNIMMLCLSPNKGGLELYAFDTAVHLEQQGHQVHYILNAQGELKDHAIKALQDHHTATPATLIKSPRSFIAKLFLARKLAKYIKQHDIQILHMHWNKDLFLAVWIKRFASNAKQNNNLKLVYSRHMQITRTKHDAYHKFIYRHVDCMLVSTLQMQQEAQTFLPIPAKHIQLLYLGCEKYSGPDDATTFSKTTCAKAKFKIGLFGRIEHGKGQHLMLDALIALRKKNVSACCVIVGHIMDQNYYDELQDTIKQQNLSDSVQFMGFVDTPQQLMRNFDVVVSTTFHETFGLVLIEAMRQGICVLGANAGGVQEIIDDAINGKLFTTRDANDLAEQLYYIYNNPEQRKNMAQQGKLKADAHFSAEHHYQKLLILLTKLAEKNPI